MELKRLHFFFFFYFQKNIFRNLKNLQVKIKKLDGESQRQNEIIYRADFQIQLMERKIPSALGY
jgi:hypothetical protein